ncbi:hypothetical protein EYF80_051216 [Liparis tanakae]|uniref:Uncharacterized protein n=1 Tax=Liparis tanakae TaxID=230148 RepID=A0A4Z2FCX9_9TELE|nr:hypothetical protein EYF80_051216 [Liparis tanakae]
MTNLGKTRERLFNSSGNPRNSIGHSAIRFWQHISIRASQQPSTNQPLTSHQPATNQPLTSY